MKTSITNDNKKYVSRIIKNNNNNTCYDDNDSLVTTITMADDGR